MCGFLTPTPTATVTVTPFLTPTPTPTVTVAPFLAVSSYFYCVNVTLTPTVTITPTLTPTITPSLTPNACFCYDVIVTQHDINSASGNTNPVANGRVTVIYYDFDEIPQPFSVTSAGIYTICNKPSESFDNLGIEVFITYTQDNEGYNNLDDPQLFTSQYITEYSSCTQDGDCVPITQTPTPTATPTPGLSLTPTVTPTITPFFTPSPSPDCSGVAISFEYICEFLSPTPTPTNTLTPFLTQTPTPTTTMGPNLGASTYFYCDFVTPTVTPTPTQTLPDIYWFSGCCLINNITFGLYNLPVSVIVGEIYYVEIEGIFSGCSTVVTTATGGIYGNSTLVNYTDCIECIANNPCVPIPTVTPTPTVTQTPNCITISFEYVCDNLTPTPTPTQTLTPFLTQTPTPTTTLAPNLGVSSYFYCDLVTPTPTLTPFFTLTPTPTPTVTLTSFLTPTPTLTQFFTPTPTITPSVTPDCITINFEYVCSNLTPTPTPTVTITPYLTPTITPTETLPPYLNASIYLYCQLVTPTPTPNIMTPTPTQTATVTPTLTPGLTGCGVYQYCVHLGNPDYDGTYTNAGYYNGHTYYLNSGTNSVIYYNNTTWCVSDTLGGTCILYGSVPPTSPCPSFSNTVFSTGACPTPTPTPTPSVTPTLTPTVSPTVTLTPTPAVTTSPTVTPTVTPTGTNACIGVQAYSIVENVPNPSPTPTVTPTSTVGKVSFNGEGVFVVLNDTFVCN